MQNCIQNSRSGKEGNGAGQSRRLARQGGQKASFGDVLIVNVLRVLGTDVLLAQEDRQTSHGRSQSETVSGGTGMGRSSNIPIQDILAPEDLLTRLANQGVGDVLLALVQSELVADTNSNTSVAQQTSVISLGHTMDLRQKEALQRRDGNVGGERLEGGGPILLEESGVLVGPRLEGVSLLIATRLTGLSYN